MLLSVELEDFAEEDLIQLVDILLRLPSYLFGHPSAFRAESYCAWDKIEITLGSLFEMVDDL